MWWFCFKTCDTNQHTSLPRLKNGHRNSHFGWRAGTIWYLYCFYKSGFRSVSGKGHERFGFHHSWKIPRLSDVMCRFNLCESLFYIGISTYVWVPQGNPSFLQLPDDIATSPFRQKKQLIDLALNLNSWGSDDRSVACHFFQGKESRGNKLNKPLKWKMVMERPMTKYCYHGTVVATPAGPFWMYPTCEHCKDASESKIARRVLAESRQSDVRRGKWVPLRQPQLFDEGSISGSFFDALKFGESQGWHPPHSFCPLLR